MGAGVCQCQRCAVSGSAVVGAKGQAQRARVYPAYMEGRRTFETCFRNFDRVCADGSIVMCQSVGRYCARLSARDAGRGLQKLDRCPPFPVWKWRFCTGGGSAESAAQRPS